MNPNTHLIEIVSDGLRDMLGDDFDDATFWDSLDGETDVMDVVGHLIMQRIDAQQLEIAAKGVAETYQARAKRMAEKAKAISAVLCKVMDATGQTKIPHPLATVSKTKGRARVNIVDESAIPSQLTVTTIKPDAAAIKKQLEADVLVPGAELVTGPDGVTVRIK